jgi:FixJ family two-component response regulator
MREKTNGKPTSARDVKRPKVFVVDPDPLSSKFVADLVRAHKLAVERFDSGEEFWDALDGEQTGCVVMEIDLPGLDGIRLQERMALAKILLPVVMIASESDVAVAVRAMKSGVVDFLQKPCHPLELWEAIQNAIEKHRVRLEQAAICARIRAQLDSLTEEEELVMRMVLEGKPNKTIAHQLGLSVRTIDFRRASILRKMQASSLVELAQSLMIVGYSLQLPAGVPVSAGGSLRAAPHAS